MCAEEHDVLSRHGSAMGCRRVPKSSVAAVPLSQGVALMQNTLAVYALSEVRPRSWLLPAFLGMRVP